MNLAERQLVLYKVEGNYGVDPTPVVASDAILTSGKVTVEIVDISKKRNVALPYYGALKEINLGEGVKIVVPIEVRGSGVNTTPPRIGAFLRSANFTQSIGADNVAYDPNSAAEGESGTLYFYQDGLLWKVLGCVVEQVKLTCKANEVCTFEFSLIGLWGGAASITDVAYPSPTFETTIPPVFQSASFTIDAYAGIIENLSMTVKNKIGKKIDANAASGVGRYRIVGRDVEGSCDPEWVAKATYDPWTTWSASTAGAVGAVIGGTAGNKLTLSLPNVLKRAPKLGEREGAKMYQLDFDAHPTLAAGNNEIQFKFN